MLKQAYPKWAGGRAPLLLSLTIYTLLAVLYLFAVPTGESPDEPGHLQCIEQVSMLGRLPQIDPLPEGDAWWSRGRIISGRMCYHMPLYYLVAGGVQKVVATAAAEPIDYEFPRSNPDFGPNPAMFDHSAKTSFWSLPEPENLIVLRLLSIVFGGVLVWASYAAARRLLPEQPPAALLAALLTATWPQFIFLSRALNNDSLATALAAVLLVVLLDVKRPQRFALAALLSVLAVFTKLSVLFTVAAVLLVWGLEFWLIPGERRRYLRALGISLALFTAAFLLLLLIPTLADRFTQGASAFAAPAESVFTWTYWRDVAQMTASSGWGRFGWMNVAAPQSHATIWWAFLLGTAVLGLIFTLKSRQKITIRLQIGVMVVWLLLLGLSYFQINLNRFQPQFRFVLAAIPVLTSLSAAGCLWWLKGNGRRQFLLIFSVTLALIYYNYWIIFSLLGPAYGWQG